MNDAAAQQRQVGGRPPASLGPSWIAFLWSALVSALSGWIVWSWVDTAHGVARTAPLLYLALPVVGVVGWFTLGEPWDLRKMAGAAIALIEVALANRAPAPRSLPMQEPEKP